jgi:hypothetical protein
VVDEIGAYALVPAKLCGDDDLRPDAVGGRGERHRAIARHTEKATEAAESIQLRGMAPVGSQRLITPNRFVSGLNIHPGSRVGVGHECPAAGPRRRGAQSKMTAI